MGKNYLADEIVESLKRNDPVRKRPVFDFIVRLIDIFASLFGIIFLSPFFLLISIAILLDDFGPIFFKQKRLGKNGETFSIMKFRSMIQNAENKGSKLRMVKGDPRITRVGKILREFHLDEFPQLLNVLKGDMSLVGPRPALPFQYDYYEDWEKPRVYISPGMTGLSQVFGGNALNWDQRIIVDVYYVRHRNFFLYISIFVKTFIQLFYKGGIYRPDGKVMGWTRGIPDWYHDSIEEEKNPKAQEKE